MVALLVLLACTAALIVRSRALTGGHQAYALDDTYIHLAIARSVAESGVWGITPQAFTSASSSPLWTGLLGVLFAVGGVVAALPLALNLLFAGLLLALFHRELRRAGLPAGAIAAALLVMIFAVPLPPLILVGMEHSLHAVVSLGFLLVEGRLLERPDRSDRRRWLLALLALAPLLTATRYEGLFLVLAACLLLAWRGRFAGALAVGAAAWLPVVGYGLVSLRHGSLFWPNSLLLKAAPPSLTTPGALAGFATVWLTTLAGAPHLLIVLVACLVPLLLTRREDRGGAWLIVAVWLIATGLHLQLARIGWFYRYEAYLMACGVALATLTIARLWRTRPLGSGRAKALAAAALLAAATPLVYRGAVAMARTPRAMANVYQQQVQMGRFVHHYYRGATVAVNDVGAVAYYGGAGVLDLSGLADVAVLRAKREGRYTSARMDSVARARRTRMAIVYPGWFARYGGMPSSWIPVGRWTVSQPIVLGDSTVTFYALDEGEAATLRRQLGEFSTRLPPGVRVSLVTGPAGD